MRTQVAAPHSRLVALLGPTNTGKTHRAIVRMLEHPSGMLGLPLRLLAREVYDRVTRELGEEQVALVTGEEKRVGRRARYWICTVEAMPLSEEVDFLAVDEIQLAGHPWRGHV
ncbi:MAG TPA: helicase, partial [Polyangiaceae bacterium]|nr:helicase [Polyangiaceae bacterium]